MIGLLTPDNFKDFQLLDTGEGLRLERWGEIILVRPDPQVIWQKHLSPNEWDKAHAVFVTEKKRWEIRKKFEQPWPVNYQDTKLLARLTPFKHTGIFAEQASNWKWMLDRLSGKFASPAKILNLFAYTGAATVILTKMGHFVTHVDASKPAIGLAKENQKVNNLPENSIRWILDDAAKFVKRELKRGVTYDGILMDPPAFGHSPQGKVWKFNQHLPGLLADCVALLSKNARFLIVNGYATNSSALAIQNILEDAIAVRRGQIECGELCLAQRDGRKISTGIFARWSPINS